MKNNSERQKGNRIALSMLGLAGALILLLFSAVSLGWFTSNKQNANPKTGPACVLDADMMSYPKLKELLTKLNSIENARIIITPHLKELSSFCSICGLGTYSVSELSSIKPTAPQPG